MTALDQAVEQAKELLSGLGPVAHRKMFGGAGLYLEGAMFALIADEELYLKADDALAEALSAEGAQPFVYHGKGRPVTMSYWRMPEAALDDPALAASWGARALDVAQAAARAKPPKRRAAPRSTARSGRAAGEDG